jgi:glycine C-acetyltransferase
LFTFSFEKQLFFFLKKALELVMGGSGLSQKVAANTTRFRQGMTSAGFKILGENHPICPVFLEDAKLASTMAERMLSK